MWILCDVDGNRCESVKAIVQSGIAVMGHIGLTPQGISVLGGFRAQGRTAIKGRKIVDDALRLQDAGAFAVVIECVPAIVAQAVTEALEIPTIGKSNLTSALDSTALMMVGVD